MSAACIGPEPVRLLPRPIEIGGRRLYGADRKRFTGARLAHHGGERRQRLDVTFEHQMTRAVNNRPQIGGDDSGRDIIDARQARFDCEGAHVLRQGFNRAARSRKRRRLEG